MAETPLTNKRRAAMYVLIGDFHDYAEGMRVLNALADAVLDTLMHAHGYRWTGGAWVRDLEEVRP